MKGSISMKKIMVAAFLVIVLSFSLVVPVFAADPVRIIGSYYYNPFDSWDGSGFGGGTHTTTPATWTLSEEDFLSLYYGAVESNSNSYSFSLRQCLRACRVFCVRNRLQTASPLIFC